MFFGLLHTITSRKRLNLVIAILALSGLFQVLYQGFQSFGGEPYIWWFYSGRGMGGAAGTFYNKNSFAAYILLILFLTIGYAFAQQPFKNLSSGWRKFLSRHSSDLLRSFFYVYLSAILLLGLFFSFSRGGIIAFLIAFNLMIVVYLVRRGNLSGREKRRRSNLMAVLLVIAASFAIQAGIEPVIQRFENLGENESFFGRIRYNERTYAMAQDHKLGGVGAGNFPYAHPKYQHELDKRMFFPHAHNHWLQFLSETGWIGAACLFLLASAFLLILLRKWTNRSDRYAIHIALGVICGMVALMIHSFVSVHLVLPGISLTSMAVMAVGFAAVHLRRMRPRDKLLYRHIQKDRPIAFHAVLLLVLFIVGILSVWLVRHFIAEAYCNTAKNRTLYRDPDPPMYELERAIAWHQGNAEYWYKKAKKTWRSEALGQADPETAAILQADIIQDLEKAAELNPFESKYHQRLIYEYSKMWREPDYRTKWQKAADMAADRCAYYAGDRHASKHLYLAKYWTRRSKQLTRTEKQTAIQKARRHYLIAQKLDGRPKMRKEVLEYVWQYYRDPAFLRTVISPKHLSLIDEFLQAKHQTEHLEQ